MPSRTNEDSLMNSVAVGESDEVAVVAKDEFATETSSIGNQHDPLMKKMQKEAKTLDFQQVPAEGRVSTVTLIRPIEEVRHTQHSGGNDVLAPISNGQSPASPSAGLASTVPPRRNMINQNGVIALAETRAASAVIGMKVEASMLMAALRSNVVHKGKNLEFGSGSSEPANKSVNKPATEPADQQYQGFR